MKFHQLIKTLHGLPLTCPVALKNEYSNQEMFYYISLLEKEYLPNVQDTRLQHISNIVTKSKRQTLVEYISSINHLIKTYKVKRSKLCHSGKNAAYMASAIIEFLTEIKHDKNFYRS